MTNKLEELKKKIEAEKDVDIIYLLKSLLKDLKSRSANYEYKTDFFKKTFFHSFYFNNSVFSNEKEFEGYLKYFLQTIKVLIDLKLSIVIKIKIDSYLDCHYHRCDEPILLTERFKKLKTEINKLIESNEWTDMIGFDDPIYETGFRRIIGLRKIKGYETIKNKKRINFDSIELHYNNKNNDK